jgi:hypothetical protein
MKLDLLRFYKKIKRDKQFISNKYIGISLNRSFPRTLWFHRGVTRHVSQTLYKDVRITNSYAHVDALQHTIKDYHDVAVTMECSNFFRICSDLQMESEYIEIR